MYSILKKTNNFTNSNSLAILLSFLILLSLGCNSSIEPFQIKKSQLGAIKTGMTIAYIEKNLIHNLKKEVSEAGLFNISGGGVAYLYSDDSGYQFGLVPKYETDTVCCIIALSSKYKTSNGLHVNSTIREIQKVYPKMKVNLNLMSDIEEFYDKENDIVFCFMTNESKRIGSYPKFDKPSTPLNLDIKTDWILIH